jgi:hypothetical protein
MAAKSAPITSVSASTAGQRQSRFFSALLACNATGKETLCIFQEY